MSGQQETPAGWLRDALDSGLTIAETLMSEGLDLAKRLLALAEQAHDALCKIEWRATARHAATCNKPPANPGVFLCYRIIFYRGSPAGRGVRKAH